MNESKSSVKITLHGCEIYEDNPENVICYGCKLIPIANDDKSGNNSPKAQEKRNHREFNVKGLGVTLDPSHLIYGSHAKGGYDSILDYVIHVRLRDTTAHELQVRVGQGDVEYGRLVSQLGKHRYNRALSVDILPMPDVDQAAEMPKFGCCWRACSEAG